MDHYAIDSGVREIYRLVSSTDREADPTEPIKLLEVYDYALPSGIIPIHFPPHPASGLTFPTEIVQIAPEELDQLRAKDLPLPEGWELGPLYPKSGRDHPEP
jgi:hypothetical protein